MGVVGCMRVLCCCAAFASPPPHHRDCLFHAFPAADATHTNTTMRTLACLGLLAAGAHAAAAVGFVPATDPRILTAGRTRINGDGSRSWDWEGVSFTITVSGASRVQVVANTTTAVGARLMTTLTSVADNFAGFVASEVWIDPSFNVSGYTLADAGAFTPSFYHLPLARGSSSSGGVRVPVDPSSLYTVAAGLSPSKTYTLRVFSEVEPAYEGSGVGSVNTLAGFVTDGTLAAATPLARSIEFVGDSITVRAPLHLVRQWSNDARARCTPGLASRVLSSLYHHDAVVVVAAGCVSAGGVRLPRRRPLHRCGVHLLQFLHVRPVPLRQLHRQLLDRRVERVRAAPS